MVDGARPPRCFIACCSVGLFGVWSALLVGSLVFRRGPYVHAKQVADIAAFLRRRLESAQVDLEAGKVKSVFSVESVCVF